MRYHTLAIEALEARIAPANFRASMDVNLLSGDAGFELSCPDGEFYKATNIGDFNGDGFSDLAVVSLTAGGDAGKVYVVYGNHTGYPALLDLGSLNGTNGFSITGLASGDQLGYSLDGGDMNGDGRADLAIGAPGTDKASGDDFGTTYVIFGKTTTPASISLGTLTSATGFKVDGGQAGEKFGSSVAIGGSINGDGFGDLVVGAPMHLGVMPEGNYRTGLAAVIFGKASGFTNLDGFSTLNGTNGFTVTGVYQAHLGTVVNILNDINGDNIAELALGDSSDGALPLTVDQSESDVGHIIFGKTSPWSSTYRSDDFERPAAIEIRDMRGAEIGSYFRTQDLDGNGINDLLGVGAFFRGRYLFIGGVAALRAGPGMPSDSYYPEEWKTATLFDKLDIYKYAWPRNFYIDGGDFDGDGQMDMLVDWNDSSLVFGSSLKGIHIVGKKDSGMTIQGLSTLDEGPRMQFIGDINGDGFDDLAIQRMVTVNDKLQERMFITFGTDIKFSHDGKSASWTDTDGDAVTLKTTKYHLEFSSFQFAKKQAGALGIHLDTLKLFYGNHEGTDLIFSVKQNLESGDGLIDIGKIDALVGHLGSVNVPGHVSVIDAAPAKSLSVVSLGPEPDDVLLGPSALGHINSFSVTGNLSGTINAEGFGTFKVHNILDGAVIQTSGSIGLLQAASVGTATITANSLAKLVVTGDAAAGLAGDFKAKVTLTNEISTTLTHPILGSVKIAGLVKDAIFQVEGSVGTFRAGAMQNSAILASFHANSLADPLSGGVFLTTSAVNSLVITGTAASSTASGKAFEDSSVIAAAIRRVSIPSADETNGGTPLGIGFRDSVGSVILKAPLFSYDKETGGTQGTGDFKVMKL